MSLQPTDGLNLHDKNMIVDHIRFLRKTWESRILTKFSNINENGFWGLTFEHVFLRLCASVFIYSCDQINSDQPGKMNIFKCSHAIPRLYQLSNGIFVPMNIENGHNRLCTFFFSFIPTFTFEQCSIETVQRWKK